MMGKIEKRLGLRKHCLGYKITKLYLRQMADNFFEHSLKNCPAL